MIAFPPAKMNLGLQILRRRADGFHDIASVMAPLALVDILEVVKSDSFSFTSSGLDIPGGDVEDNLCVKAYRLLEQAHDLPPVAIHLHKVIPMGAGLGGGSSDAAWTLRLLNDLFGLGLAKAALEAHAATLGSDCAFFIRDQAQYATGRGEVLEPISVDLSGHHLVLVTPDVHVSTKAAYAGITPNDAVPDLREVVAQPMETWKNNLFNDFEASVFQAHPSLAETKAKLYELGAVYAAMSGSGSSLFGLFLVPPTDSQLATLQFPALRLGHARQNG